MTPKIGRRLTDSETQRVAVLAAYIDASPHEWPKGVADIALLCHGYLDLLAELAEARKDGERYRYIRTEAMIDYCTGSKRHNRISWPTIYAAAPVDGGSYRDRFDAAIDNARGTR